MSWTWGIDPSTVRIALGMVHGSSFRVASAGVAAPQGSRLQLVFRRTLTLVRDWAEVCPPGEVWIEQPGGKTVSPQLWYAVGVCCAAVEYALPGVPVMTVPPSKWKLAAFGKGNGNAGKPFIFNAARAMGYEGNVQDEADALGIACGGLALDRRDPKVLVVAS